MWTKRNWGPTQVGSGKLFSPYPSGPLMRQERLLSVGTNGGGYIIYYVPIKMISLVRYTLCCHRTCRCVEGLGKVGASILPEGSPCRALPERGLVFVIPQGQRAQGCRNLQGSPSYLETDYPSRLEGSKYSLPPPSLPHTPPKIPLQIS